MAPATAIRSFSSPKILEAIEAFLEGRAIPQQVIELENPVDFLEPRDLAEVGLETLAKYVGEYEIAPGNIRRVILAGDLLFTQRGEGRALPIRPMSETDFYYEGMDLRLRFDLDAEGRVVGMTMFSGGSDEGEKAVRK